MKTRSGSMFVHSGQDNSPCSVVLAQSFGSVVTQWSSQLCRTCEFESGTETGFLAMDGVDVGVSGWCKHVNRCVFYTHYITHVFVLKQTNVTKME